MLFGNKGSSTIEAVLVFSLIIIVLTLLIFSFQVMYQKILLSQKAVYLANTIAVNWHVENDLELITEKAKGYIRSGDVIVEYKKSMGLDYIEITIKQEVIVPFSGLKAYFTGENNLLLTGKACSAIADNAGFIRNVDMILEYIPSIND